MWSGAARRLIDRASIACDDLPGPLLEVLNRDMPWHGPNRVHPELNTPDAWWDRVFAVYAEGLARCGWLAAATPSGLDALRAEILDARAYSRFEDVVPVLTVLREDGWRHVIVSNHVPELEDIVANLGIRSFFTDVITSGLIGYEKPHAQMFEAALRCAVPGAPIWMIGDNQECDCDPVGRLVPPRSWSVPPHPPSSAMPKTCSTQRSAKDQNLPARSLLPNGCNSAHGERSRCW